MEREPRLHKSRPPSDKGKEILRKSQESQQLEDENKKTSDIITELDYYPRNLDDYYLNPYEEEPDLGRKRRKFEAPQPSPEEELDKDKPELGGRILEPTTAEEISKIAEAFAAVMRSEAPFLNERGASAEEILDIGRSGRLSELFQSIYELAQEPPARAPRKWDPDSGETAAAAILEIYDYWIQRKRMHLGIVRTLDPLLYRTYLNRRVSPNLGAEEAKACAEVAARVPKKQEYTSQELSRWDDLGPVKQARLSSTKSMRKKSKIELKPD